MGKITFILGGARSGKSTYATNLAKKGNKKVAFIATCLPLDKEMKQRIETHQKNRPSTWKIFVAEKNISSVIKKIGSQFDVVIIDCLTLFVSNLILAKYRQEDIDKEVNEIIKELKSIKAKSFIVSNEVGLGIVPGSRLGRDFRDSAGRINQLVASRANKVFFMVSGMALKAKS